MSAARALLSLLLVGLGQPAFSEAASLLAAALGYGLFWEETAALPSRKGRFYAGCLWMTAVQIFQLSWMRGHPFFYIYLAWPLLALGCGLQFGLLTAFLTKKRLESPLNLLAFAGAWVFFEWSRLQLLSGFSWNPSGLALSSSLYSRQLAALFGLFGLSFWVILSNLLFLRARLSKRAFAYGFWIAAAALPYLFGLGRLSSSPPPPEKQLRALLVQTAFPCIEAFSRSGDPVTEAACQWRRVLELLAPFKGKELDLIVFPENFMPFAAFFPVFELDSVRESFSELFPEDSLPRLSPHLAMREGARWKVNNAYWLQAIAELFDAEVIAGLEDRDYLPEGRVEVYNAAYLFGPGSFLPQRYEKQILVPMGEQIPLACLRKLAAGYGIEGSFSEGKGGELLRGRRCAYGVSICYEETYGHVIRPLKRLGAELLVNVTNDGWFLGSGLPRQHLEHARLRSVELGLPSARACNTGVTCALDSFGRELASLGGKEEEAGALEVLIPIRRLKTLYGFFGDRGILFLSALSLLLPALRLRR